MFGTGMCGQTLQFIVIANCAISCIIYNRFTSTLPPKGRTQSDYSVADISSGSAATRLRWGGQLYMHLEARIIRMLFTGNYQHQFKQLWIIEESLADVGLLVMMIWLELCTSYSSSYHYHFQLQ